MTSLGFFSHAISVSSSQIYFFFVNDWDESDKTLSVKLTQKDETFNKVSSIAAALSNIQKTFADLFSNH